MRHLVLLVLLMGCAKELPLSKKNTDKIVDICKERDGMLMVTMLNFDHFKYPYISVVCKNLETFELNKERKWEKKESLIK